METDDGRLKGALNRKATMTSETNVGDTCLSKEVTTLGGGVDEFGAKSRAEGRVALKHEKLSHVTRVAESRNRLWPEAIGLTRKCLA